VDRQRAVAEPSIVRQAARWAHCTGTDVDRDPTYSPLKNTSHGPTAPTA
jgi:hypothetical protein